MSTEGVRFRPERPDPSGGVGGSTAGRLVYRILLAVLLPAALALVSEAVLRGARPHHGWLNSMLYLPAASARFETAKTTPELLRQTFFGFRPGHVNCGFVLNSRGFRTREYSYGKKPGSYRILTLGDSFTFASGCVPWRSHWPVRLRTTLAARAGRKVEVVNLGMPAVGPRFELRLWELEGRRLEPDLVVLAFFVGNDFDDDKTPLDTLKEKLTRWSYTFRLVRNLSRSGPGRFRPESPEGRGGRGGKLVDDGSAAYDPLAPTFGLEEFLRIEWNRLGLVRREGAEAFERRFAAAAETVSRLHRAVTGAGAAFVVLVIPDEFQVNGELRDQLLEHYGAEADSFDLDLPQRRLVGFFEEEGIPYVDLLPVFREHSKHERLYKVRDTHWNVAGNKLAVEELAAFLESTIPRLSPSGGTSSGPPRNKGRSRESP